MTNRLLAAARRSNVWLLIALFLAVTFFQVGGYLRHPVFLFDVTSKIGLTRYTVERILYLLPIVWGGLSFGWKGATATSLAAVACMLPRALFDSPTPEDALVETGAVFFIGNLMAYSLEALRRERKRRAQLEAAEQQIRTSEQKYRELFEKAHDAIWVHDLEGVVLMANSACQPIVGCEPSELIGTSITRFLTDDSARLAREVKRKLLEGEAIEQPYEQHIIRKDGSDRVVKMATSLVVANGAPIGFQHIARDVTEEIKMQENLHFLLQQITRAQEEERKRIARELHDDTIQALVVHGQRLYDVASIERLPGSAVARLEGLRQQANKIIEDLRRLSQDLRPSSLDRFGLLPALRRLASDIEAQSGISTRVEVIGTERRLPAEVELVLFRIVQEALRNTWKHARATSTEIKVEFAEGKTNVTVTDNGIGFDVRQAIDDPRQGKLGLAGMRERAKLLGGTLAVRSELGKGTTLTAELPV